MLEECCGEGYIWSIPYGSLNYCFLTQGTTVCSHMTAVSQSSVVTVCTPAQVCSLNVGTVLHWRDLVLCLRALLWRRTRENVVNLRFFFDNNMQNGNKSNFTALKELKSTITPRIFLPPIYLLPNIQHGAYCYVQHIVHFPPKKQPLSDSTLLHAV